MCLHFRYKPLNSVCIFSSVISLSPLFPNIQPARKYFMKYSWKRSFTISCYAKTSNTCTQKNLQFIEKYRFGTLGVLHCQEHMLQHEETVKFCDGIWIIFHLLSSLQVCSAGRPQLLLHKFSFFHMVMFIHGGQQNKSGVFIARLSGTLPCWPQILSSHHSANCKPIVALSSCARVEDLAENRNICYAIYGVV